jgi:hypothetical protein
MIQIKIGDQSFVVCAAETYVSGRCTDMEPAASDRKVQRPVIADDVDLSRAIATADRAGRMSKISREAQAQIAVISPLVQASRSLNFWILPDPVSGKASTTNQCFGVLCGAREARM